MKKLLLILILLLTVSGCSKKVSYKVSPEFGSYAPGSVVILRLGGVEGMEASDMALFRTIIADKLTEKNYLLISEEVVNKIYLGTGSEAIKKMSPADAASLFKADAVLYGAVTSWDKRSLAKYASLRVGSKFELYAANGIRLWAAAYQTKEADLRFDTEQMKLSILSATEPRIQRNLDDIFITLPRVTAAAREKKLYFDWLP